MNQDSKRRRLSLKKTAGQSTVKSVQNGNTIISMFKKQTDKQSKLEIKQGKESGSKGDVVITDVIGLDTDFEKSTSNSSCLGKIVHDSHKPNGKVVGKNLDVSERKRSKAQETNGTEGVSDSDSDFDLNRPLKLKRKSRNLKPLRTVSERNASEHGSPYKLRKKNTVPPEFSDCEIEYEQKTEKALLQKTETLGAEGLKSVKVDEKLIFGDKANSEISSDDVIFDISSPDSRGKCHRDTYKRKVTSSSGRRSLSLKKKKSECDKAAGRRSFEDTEKDGGFKEEEPLDHLSYNQTSTKDSYSLTSNIHEANQLNSSETDNKEKHVVKDKRTSDKANVKNVNSILMQSKLDCKISHVGKRSEEGKHSKGKRKTITSDRGNSKTNSKSKDITCNTEKTEFDGGIDAKQNASGDSDNDNDDKNDAAEKSETPEFQVPYYLENFKTIMKSVLDDEENARLFDESDMQYIETFNQLEESSQKLYVRLFSRKLSWLPMSKVKYPEISRNIPDLVDGLVSSGLLHSGAELSDLFEVLKILSAPDLKGLAKSFHINGLGMTKQKIIDELTRKGQQSSISSMFKGGVKGTMEKTILTRAKTYLGKVCRLQDQPRAVFIRILMLFSLYNTNFDEESGGGGQNQLFQMLMVNIGRVVYPSYTVNRHMSVFKDRAALVRFETALQFEMDIQGLTERGKWTQAYDIYKRAKEAGKPVLKDKKYLKWDKTLPQYLRLYTAGSVYTRIDNQGVEVLQRLRLYREAVNLLEELLAQDLYCIQYRGHWYERLALNLEAHLKSVEKSLSIIKQGLLDPTVRTGRRLALYERARKICEASKSKYANRMCEYEHEHVLPTPEVHVEGMVISDAMSVGMKYQFVMQGDSDSVTFCAVEEWVLDYYKQNGYPEGLHAEGSIVSNLFVLLFWDIMFMDIENVFHGPFQSCPLDIATQEFYLNRQEYIDDRLNWLKNASVEELITETGQVWSDHEGKMCSGINWERFSGPETHQNLISCMGGQVIAGILERYVKDPRHTRSGFPDLTLWNTGTKQLKICEVKGPNDRLSYKQILWIDYLLKLGVDAEVCYVKAVGSKKLKPEQKQ